MFMLAAGPAARGPRGSWYNNMRTPDRKPALTIYVPTSAGRSQIGRPLGRGRLESRRHDLGWPEPEEETGEQHGVDDNYRQQHEIRTPAPLDEVQVVEEFRQPEAHDPRIEAHTDPAERLRPH